MNRNWLHQNGLRSLCCQPVGFWWRSLGHPHVTRIAQVQFRLHHRSTPTRHRARDRARAGDGARARARDRGRGRGRDTQLMSTATRVTKSQNLCQSP